MFNGRDYNPTELLDVCTVDRFKYSDTSLMTMGILAGIVANQGNPEEIMSIINKQLEIAGKNSIGQSLERLCIIENTDDLQGGLDGIDALTYHLSKSVCEDAIKALEKVLERFKGEQI